MTRLLLVATLIFLPALASAQDSKSAALVTEFVKLLDQMNVQNIATAQDGGFAGAMYVPGSQLFIIQGTFPAANRGASLLERKMYRDLYTDLNSAADLATRVFISDLGADGLKLANKNRPFDMADVGPKSYRFDGDWGKQKLSRDDYTKAFESTDERYAQIVRALIEQLKK